MLDLQHEPRATLDVPQELRKCGDSLRGKRVAELARIGNVGAPQLGERHVPHVALRVARSIKRGIVNDDELAVARHLNVAFKERHAGLNRTIESDESVLRTDGGIAAMSDDKRHEYEPKKENWGRLPAKCEESGGLGSTLCRADGEIENARVDENLQKVGIELSVRRLIVQDRQGFLDGNGFLVGAIPRDERVENVGDRHHP